MGVFKMILYPFGIAFASLGLVMLVGMAAFGTEPKAWATWQNHLVSDFGIAAGMVGMLVGAWLAVRMERRPVH